jgi:hypothetical protein
MVACQPLIGLVIWLKTKNPINQSALLCKSAKESESEWRYKEQEMSAALSLCFSINHATVYKTWLILRFHSPVYRSCALNLD